MHRGRAAVADVTKRTRSGGGGGGMRRLRENYETNPFFGVGQLGTKDLDKTKRTQIRHAEWRDREKGTREGRRWHLTERTQS
jgi:hypothetical protein